MAASAGPNLGLVYGYADGDNGWGSGSYNPGFQKLDTVVNMAVISSALATPPGGPSAGDRYIVAASPTGAWVGHAKDVAAWLGGAWVFYTPKAGWRAYDVAQGLNIGFDGSNWSKTIVAKTEGGTGGITGSAAARNLSLPYHGKVMQNIDITGDTSEHVGAWMTIPAGIGAQGSVEINAIISLLANATDSFVTLRVVAGASSGTTGGTTLVGTTLVKGLVSRSSLEIFNDGATNTQGVFTSVIATFGTTTNAVATSAIDTTADWTISLNGKNNTNGDHFIIRHARFTVRAAPGN